jgi:hypothetical protein
MRGNPSQGARQVFRDISSGGRESDGAHKGNRASKLCEFVGGREKKEAQIDRYGGTWRGGRWLHRILGACGCDCASRIEQAVKPWCTTGNGRSDAVQELIREQRLDCAL